MSKFKFDESLFREFKSSAKEGLSDIAINDEEIDKIEFELSHSSRKIQLRTDYSDFQNHIFFGSAYAAVSFALARIAEYPIFGELKDKNEWRRVNNGFENYFFDQYPKQQGYANFSSSYIEVSDHQYQVRPGTGSITFECIIKPADNIQEAQGRKAVFALYEPDGSGGAAIYFSSSIDKRIYFEVTDGSDTAILSCSYGSYVSASHHIAFAYDAANNKQTFYVDGVAIQSGTTLNLGAINPPSQKIYIGAMSSSAFGGFGSYFTGSIDDARLWISSEARSSELIKKNYYRTIHADHSGGLKLYYKFNEPDFGTRVVNYSGLDELDGVFSGAFSYNSSISSGVLASWFKDSGDIISSQTNLAVSSSLASWRMSGSLYDKENRNLIFNLVPSFFINDQEANEEMHRFLLLIARNYDQLKLYIDNIANIKDTSLNEFNNTPDQLLNLVAENYGMDIGGVYEGASALEYIFGENVLPSGSLDNSINVIRSQIKRNLLNNLIYIIKTKSTRQALEAALRSVGLEEDIININEYSLFSGGIETGRTQRTVERRVVRFATSASVCLTSSVFTGSSPSTYEVRTLFHTGSRYLTSSVISLSGAGSRFYLEVERQSLTAANAVAKLYSVSSSTTSVISSSVLSLFDNNWINFAIVRNPPAGTFKLFVTKLDRDEISISESVSASAIAFANAVPTANTNRIGSRNNINFFDGYMQEFRHWSVELSSSTILNHARDFESLEVSTFPADIATLKTHLKLNDYSGSVAGVSEAHNYVHGQAGSIYDEADLPFTASGKYITKLDPSYSYDFAINNDKIRIRNGSTFTDEDIVEDIPYLSVDMSPAISLNREIIRWFGDLEKFNNIIGQPYNKYRDELEFLNQYKHHFFAERTNNKISFKNYLNVLKWFDSNFTFFLSQLIPIDINSSLSNFVIEPHLFEYNKITYPFPSKKFSSPLLLVGSASLSPIPTSNVTARNLGLGDPGRFGSPASASAALSYNNFNYSASTPVSSALGVNFQRSSERKLLTKHLQENSGSDSVLGYGNGWYTNVITCSNYLKNVLNVNEQFHISGVHYSTEPSAMNSLYLTAAFKPINTHYTGAINGVTDQRWHWGEMNTTVELEVFTPVGYLFFGNIIDKGIGYGGGWGQLYGINKKSLVSKALFVSGSSRDRAIGINTSETKLFTDPIEKEESTNDSKIIHLWPTKEISYYRPINIEFSSSTTGSVFFTEETRAKVKAEMVGDRIDIEGFRHINISIAGKRSSISDYTTGSLCDLIFVAKFQFFNEDFGALGSFEGAFSSSLVSNKYTTRKNENEFKIVETPGRQDTGNSIFRDHEFISNFERELPKAKYMRMFLRIEGGKSIQGETGRKIAYKILVKGALFKETSLSEDRLIKVDGK